MKFTVAQIVILVVLGARAEPSHFTPLSAGCTLLDMSYDYANDTMVWPTARKFEIQNRTAGLSPQGVWIANENFCSPEHGGTHLDAPFHFARDGWTVDLIPAERLLAPAVVLDVSAEAALDADTQLTVAHLTAWESRHGHVPDGAVVLLYSGWGRHWGNATAYFGNGDGDVANFHFPGFHPDAARWLVTNRNIVGVGLDTGSMDYGATRTFAVHTIFSEHNIYGLENVARLDQLPPTGALLLIAPVKIRAGTGAPCRIFAQMCNTPSGSSTNTCQIGVLISSLGIYLVTLYLFKNRLN